MANKSLLNKTSKKPKKDKYSEISDIKKEYTYALKTELIYLGIVDDYKTLPCSVIKRSRRKSTDYYSVIFENGEKLDSIAEGFLKTPDEYDQWLLNQENGSNEDNNNDVSEVERKIIEAGLIPMKNERSCMHQMKLYHRECKSCGYESTCVYRKKYLYDKVNFN